MRGLASLTVAAMLAPIGVASDKLSIDDRIELTRGLLAEYANAKVMLPRSRKPLEIDATNGSWDKAAWSTVAKESGPAARAGDTVQITKMDLLTDRIVLQI